MASFGYLVFLHGQETTTFGDSLQSETIQNVMNLMTLNSRVFADTFNGFSFNRPKYF